MDAPESDAADPETPSQTPSQARASTESESGPDTPSESEPTSASSDPWGDPETVGPPPGGPAFPGAGLPSDDAALEQPSSIRNAVRLMWAGAVLSGINILVVFLARDELRDLIEESDSSLSADEVDSALNALLTAAGLVGVVAVALWIWMATANGQGRAWARTTATVLGVLYVSVNAVTFVGGPLTPPRVAFGLLSIALPVAILLLLYRPESTRYYDAATRRASLYSYASPASE